jgi:hypothetical protein
MKLSKKYPAIKSLLDLKRKNISANDLDDSISKRGYAITPVAKRAIIECYKFTESFSAKINRALWYEPCSSLLEDALKSYGKLSELPIARGEYIVSGMNIEVGQEGEGSSIRSECISFVTVNESSDVTLGAYDLTGIPSLVINYTYATGKYSFVHTDGDTSEFSKQRGFAADVFQRTFSVLLFAQHCGEEAKRMMSASIPRKINCLRPDKNDLGIKRIRLTASWYRDTIQGHPFMVSGHWRKQRHGEGLKKMTRKFITPYMKDGYRSKPLRNDND